MVTFVSGRRRSGKTSVAANIAVAAASAGGSVLLLDENTGRGSVCALLGLAPRFDLVDAISGERTIEEAAIVGPRGILVLPSAHGIRRLAEADEHAGERLTRELARLAGGLDLVLIDTAAGMESRLLPLGLSSDDVVVAVCARDSSVMDAYAIIKVMHRELGSRHFRVLVTMAADDAQSQALFDKMQVTARRYLGVALEYMGAVPFDAQMRQAWMLARPLVEAFPESAAATALCGHTEAILRRPARPWEAGAIETFVHRLVFGSRMKLGSSMLSPVA